jgi:hypothetical protein
VTVAVVIIVVVNCTLPDDIEELAGRNEAKNFLELRPESNPLLNVWSKAFSHH